MQGWGDARKLVRFTTLHKLCALPVRIWIPCEDVHSRWGTSPFLGRICIPGKAHPHSRWWCAFPVRHIPILGEDVHSIVIHLYREYTSSSGMGMCLTGNAYSHREWECASPGVHILTGNGNVPHRECTSTPGMGMCLTGSGNAYPHCLPHRECTSSPGKNILTVNAHSLYRVFTLFSTFFLAFFFNFSTGIMGLLFGLPGHILHQFGSIITQTVQFNSFIFHNSNIKTLNLSS